MGFYEKHFHYFDLFIAVATGLVATFTFWFLAPIGVEPPDYWLDGMRVAIYRSVAAINGTLFGFTITGLSITMTFAQLPAAKRIKDAGQMESLFSIFSRAINWLAMSTLLGIIALLFDVDARPIDFFPIAILVVQCVAISRVFRCVWILKKIAALLSKQ